MSSQASRKLRLEYQVADALPQADDLASNRIPVHRSFSNNGWHVPQDPVALSPATQRSHTRICLLGKRALDVAVAATGLVLAAPLMGVIALAIRMDSAGSIFYRTYRVGKRGRLFRFYKFRTMVNNAEQLLDEVRSLNGRPQQILVKFPQDPRVTRVGRFLRRYSLDELPQFWNILKCDMSLVGPRPTSLGEYEVLRAEHRRRMAVLPGLTGLWQVKARGNPCFETYGRLDCEYVDNWSLWLDLKILLKTIPAVLRGTGE